MIKKLKVKFCILSVTALFVLLSVIVAGMNILNYNSVVDEADALLVLLSQNMGRFPEKGDRPDLMLPPDFSPETPYESRYFTVSYNEVDGSVSVDVSKIAAVDKEKAIEYAEKIVKSKKEKGFTEEYRYIVNRENGTVRISFIDCGRRLDAFEAFLWRSIIMSVLGLIVVSVVIFVLSEKIIKPIATAYEKQKRFVTDAGHEIKTPLTIISANADILEMEIGDNNESIRDIKVQTQRLRTLTEDLVSLSRMEEEGDIKKIHFPISEVVWETADSFLGLANAQNKRLTLNLQPMLTLVGDDKGIRRLVSALADNAIKYSPENSEIVISLSRVNKYICLSVLNETEVHINQQQLACIFDRFYRPDESRNSQIGGHGVGLSVAKAIVEANGGKIRANIPREKTFEIVAVFPQ